MSYHKQGARRDWLDFMIVSSKLQYPTVPESYIQRPRLEVKLNGVFKRGLTLITAPPGSGKTMLVSGWRERAPHPVVCVTLEEADNHFLRFWLHILAAIHEASPGFDPGVTEQFVNQFLQQPRGALAFLVAECSRLSEPIAIVLDDYHTIEIPEIHESFSYWIRNMPSCLHMIVVSRIDLPFRLPKRLKYVIEWADLAFSLNEAKRFYQIALRSPVTEEQIHKWQEQTEGWILGMKLMASGNSEALIRESDDPADIREQLMTQILTQQSPETMEFLLRTAIPHHLNYALCIELTGFEAVPVMLEKLAKENVFLQRLGAGSEEWFRYHPLVAQLLQDKLLKDNPQLWQNLQRKTARWLENNGYPMEAMEHYVRGEHYEEAGMLLEGLFKQFIMSEAWTLMRYFTLIPEQTIQARPKLFLSYLFLAAGNQDADRTMQQLDAIEHRVKKDAGLRSKQETDYYMRVILVMRAYVSILKKDLDGLVHYLLVYADLGYPDDEIFAYIDYAVQESSRLRSFPGVTGHLSRAKACFEPIVRAWRHVRSYNTAYYAIGYAELMYEWNQLGEAEQYANLARSIGDEQRKAALIVPAALLQARLSFFGSKDREAARFQLHEARSALDEKELEYWSPILEAYEVKFQLLSDEGNNEAAARYIASYKAASGGAVSNRLLCALAYARALVAHGRYAEALTELRRIQKLARGHDLLLEQLEVYLLQALMCRQQGKLRRAAGLFGKAVGLSAKEGHIRVFIEEGEPIREVAYRYRELRELYRVKERHVSIRYVDQILIAFEAQEVRAEKGAESGANKLSPMEKQVLKALSKSWTSKEIAAHIGVSTGTVNTYIQRIFTKLKVNKRKQAVIEAYRLGWIEIE